MLDLDNVLDLADNNSRSAPYECRLASFKSGQKALSMWDRLSFVCGVVYQPAQLASLTGLT